jgi:hypothetical protein
MLLKLLSWSWQVFPSVIFLVVNEDQTWFYLAHRKSNCKGISFRKVAGKHRQFLLLRFNLFIIFDDLAKIRKANFLRVCFVFGV